VNFGANFRAAQLVTWKWLEAVNARLVETVSLGVNASAAQPLTWNGTDTGEEVPPALGIVNASLARARVGQASSVFCLLIHRPPILRSP
jgi:hypothetical protein